MSCPCGCGVQTTPPIKVGGVWHHGKPYWAWVCLREPCERHQIEQRNQSGDPACPWCGEPRKFLGHFVAEATDHDREFRQTVAGEKVPRPQPTAVSPQVCR